MQLLKVYKWALIFLVVQIAIFFINNTIGKNAFDITLSNLKEMLLLIPVVVNIVVANYTKILDNIFCNRHLHSEVANNSASVTESFSGFSQTWFGNVQFRISLAQRSGFFDLAAS